LSRRDARRVLAAGCLALLGAGGIASPQSPTIYVAFGDSVTEGTGDEEGGGYPPRLEGLLIARGRNADVRNRGVAGETTVDGLARIDSVLAEGGDVLLLMEGTNDLPHNVSPETIAFNLDEMAKRGERAGMDVMVATVIPRSPVANVDRENILTQQLAETIRDLGGTSLRQVADPFEEFITTPNYYQDFYSHDPDDPVGHPNARGYDKLARVFLDVIVGVDSVPPVTGLIRPQVGRTQVRPNVRIRMDVWDFGAGIDVQATDMLINGVVVDDASATGTATRLRFEYAPPQPFTGLVQIGLRSRDRASPANTVDRVVSSFRVSSESLQGDVDEDGRVDGVDLVLLGRSFGATSNQVRYLPEADFNRDEVVDGDDLAILASNFGEGSG
jgi:lysophospholipase L1-like esterase